MQGLIRPSFVILTSLKSLYNFYLCRNNFYDTVSKKNASQIYYLKKQAMTKIINYWNSKGTYINIVVPMLDF